MYNLDGRKSPDTATIHPTLPGQACCSSHQRVQSNSPLLKPRLALVTCLMSRIQQTWHSGTSEATLSQTMQLSRMLTFWMLPSRIQTPGSKRTVSSSMKWAKEEERGRNYSVWDPPTWTDVSEMGKKYFFWFVFFSLTRWALPWSIWSVEGTGKGGVGNHDTRVKIGI